MKSKIVLRLKWITNAGKSRTKEQVYANLNHRAKLVKNLLKKAGLKYEEINENDTITFTWSRRDEK